MSCTNCNNDCNCDCGCNCNCSTTCGCTDTYDSICVKYTSEELECLGIQDGDNLEDIIKKIDEHVCNVINSNCLGDVEIIDTGAGDEFLANDGNYYPITGGGGGASAWLDLTDTPAAYSTAGFLVRINAAGDGLEFLDPAGLAADGNGIYSGSDSLQAGTTTVTLPSGAKLSFTGDFGTVFEIDGDTGKVTIPGLLDPTGLQMTPVASNPGDANTLWANSGDSDKPYWGAANVIAFISDLPTVPTNVGAFTNDAGYITSNDGNGLKDGSGTIPTNTTATITDKLEFAGGQIALTPATTITPAAGVDPDIDFNNGNNQVLDMVNTTGTITPTFSNMETGASYNLEIIQGAGTHAIDWSNLGLPVKWEAGTPLSTLGSAGGTEYLLSIYVSPLGHLKIDFGAGYA